MGSARRTGDEVIRVAVESLAPGGDAFGRQVGGAAAGRATFVAFAAPGEVVKARLVREKRDVAFAELLEVETPAAGRVTPRCALFGRCGGCQWQHVDLAVQQAAKEAIVKRALRSEAVRFFAGSLAFGYRDRAKFVAVERERTVLGFKRRQSHEVIDVPACPLLSPVAARGLAWLRQHPPPPGDAYLQAGCDGFVGVKTADETLREREGVTEPVQHLDVAAPAEPPLRIAIGGFAQVGALANQVLVERVLASLQAPGGPVLELYAGAGNFTRFLVRRGYEVESSDADLVALSLGRQNVPEAKWVSPDQVSPQVHFDQVLVDPPRTGLDPQGFELACRAQRRLVYVSCDPQTLGRDARRLAEAGLHLVDADAIDLMPQTFHVEVVARFDRLR
ncbi:MAG: TRAM domain-containing protein [Myxococcales bacterium]|nr:TRAM domain-containing protein [Myxococcales bacterium]